MSNAHSGRKVPKSVLELPELAQSKSAVLNTLSSVDSQRTYGQAMDQFIRWYCSEPRLAFSRIIVLRYRIHLERSHYAPATINLHLAAVRRLAYEATDAGLLSAELAAGIHRVKGVRRLGARSGNWLTAEQGRAVLDSPSRNNLRGKRDRAILALLLGCGLRRAEVVQLSWENLQSREGRWVLADFVGKGGHIRTVPVPDWVKVRIDDWRQAARIRRGRVFRPVNKGGRMCGRGITPKVIWHVVRIAAKRAGIQEVAPHDLRRTCARLCHLRGGELEQIQFLLGHVSIQTTERYLGCQQKLQYAVNDHLGIEPETA